MLRGSVTASLIGNLSLMHVKEFNQLLIEISSLQRFVLVVIPLYSRVGKHMQQPKIKDYLVQINSENTQIEPN